MKYRYVNKSWICKFIRLLKLIPFNVMYQNYKYSTNFFLEKKIKNTTKCFHFGTVEEHCPLT